MKKLGPRLREQKSQVSTALTRIGTLSRLEDQGGPIAWSLPVYAGSDVPASWKSTIDTVNPGPPYLTGGDFSSILRKQETLKVQGSGSYPFIGDGTMWMVYDGGFTNPTFPADAYGNYSFAQLRADSTIYPDLSSLGSKAYNRLRPSTSEAQVGLAIAEAREIAPMLKSTAGVFKDAFKTVGGKMSLSLKNMQPKQAANTFLLTQFGWKPFLKDMAGIISAYQKSKAYFAQRYKDNDQWVRRFRADKRIESEDVISDSTGELGCYPFAPLSIHGLVNTADARHISSLLSSTTVWYEGVFKVYRREFDTARSSEDDAFDNLQRYMSLYGAHVSPAVLYQATPWSWLLDWFTNTGHIIKEAQDYGTGEVASKYMYVMHHSYRSFRSKSIFTVGQQHVKQDLEWYSILDIKRRQAASTNFEFYPSSITARQVAILAALGITRVGH